MKLVSIEQLHKDHVEWLSYVDHWKIEMRFLKKIATRVYDKKFETELGKEVKELLNTMKHYKRYLDNFTETINTHEAFISDYMKASNTRVNRQELLDHYKTREHMLEFYRDFKNLKEKIIKLTEKYY